MYTTTSPTWGSLGVCARPNPKSLSPSVVFSVTTASGSSSAIVVTSNSMSYPSGTIGDTSGSTDTTVTAPGPTLPMSHSMMSSASQAPVHVAFSSKSSVLMITY